MTFTATYSPEDNKLRLTASQRLDKELYERVKAMGFSWAPRQEIFVAPAWSPSREDFLIELAGEIEDEDTSLAARAEDRAERFEGYSEKRADEAHTAHERVASICDGIPLGQPILVGHHSEKHARKDAERIENGMRKAVSLWETAKYWESRAKGAIRAAKYKERPDVRARRIKGLEADKRKQEKYVSDAEAFSKLWSKSLDYEPGIRHLTMEQAKAIANYDHVCSHMCFPLKDYPRDPPASQYEGAMGIWSALDGGIITPEQARDFALEGHKRTIAYAARWLRHIDNRLTYERAMLAESGGLAADKFDLAVGGRILRRDEWLIITKLNMRDGVLNSVSVVGHWASTVPVEEITEYMPPKPGDEAKVKAATKLPPLVNYKGEGFRETLKAYYDHRVKAQVACTSVVAATETHGAHRQRCGMFDYKMVPLFITDLKVTERPPVSAAPKAKLKRVYSYSAPVTHYKAPETTAFDKLKEQLKEGVKVVSAPQLFPTPGPLARKMSLAAGLLAGKRVLEPEAGTGNLVKAIIDNATGADNVRVVAVEINQTLVQGLETMRQKTLYANEGNFEIHCADFLECSVDLGKFDAIIMNPPFANAQDIKHIEHAMGMLKPGGVLVAICANGPRQQAQLKPLATTWEDLPEGSFVESGTNVNTAMLTFHKE